MLTCGTCSDDKRLLHGQGVQLITLQMLSPPVSLKPICTLRHQCQAQQGQRYALNCHVNALKYSVKALLQACGLLNKRLMSIQS